MSKEKAYIANKQLIKKIDEIMSFQKTVLTNFYKQNIGKVDKETKPVSLEDYMVSQFNKPTSTSTVRLQKNKYVLQKQLNDKIFKYMPFEKKTTPIIPSDNPDVMRMLRTNYSKLKPFTKKQLIDSICEKYQEDLKENKITQKKINGLKYKELDTLFKSIGITELSEALKFYRVKEAISIRQKRGLDDISQDSIYYKEFSEIKEQLKDKEFHEILSILQPISKKITTSLNEFVRKMNDKKIVLENKDYINITTVESIENIFIPEKSEENAFFFKEDLDFYKIKMAIYAGKLDFDFKTTFKFFQICDNLSEVDNVLSTADFISAQNIEKSSFLNYEENEIIELN